MNGGSILVVDDHPENLRRVLHVLSARGYSARGVHSTGEADRALAEGPSQLALVDLGLGDDQDGLEWVERIRGRPGAPSHFIALAASPDPEIQNRARRAGCRGCLLTPVPLESLLAAVDACFQKGLPR